MKGLIDRFFLLVIGIVSACIMNFNSLMMVTLILVIIVCFCLEEFFEDRKGEFIITILCGLVVLLLDGAQAVVLLLIYETARGICRRQYKKLYVSLGTILGCIIIFWLGGHSVFYKAIVEDSWLAAMLVFGAGLSIYLAYNTVKVEYLSQEKLRLRDDSEESVRLEKARRALIVKQQDNEIAMATLKERNRIAREIHDNVGHLLSRCILQLGAIVMIHKDEPVAVELKDVQENLNESMTSIRNSVHNLHNEALDLEKNINDLAAENKNLKTDFEYDVDGEIPIKIKYCIIAIITEAYQNVAKHSKADTVNIVVREHPGMYQVIFSDNGDKVVLKESGIGLHNMEQRVRELGGSISFSGENGFRIFISIPKEVNR